MYITKKLSISHKPVYYYIYKQNQNSMQGFEKTGLGERVAQLFVKGFGKSTLGLAYGLSIAEALIAPAMPSTTARAGGIFMPIINSLSQSAGSHPNDPSRKKLGAYLVNTQFQGSVNSSAMFLTAAAQNLLCMKLAVELGVVVPSAWTTWFKAAVVPALAGLLITPLIMYKIFAPEITSTPEAPKVKVDCFVLEAWVGHGLLITILVI